MLLCVLVSWVQYVKLELRLSCRFNVYGALPSIIFLSSNSHVGLNQVTNVKISNCRE